MNRAILHVQVRHVGFDAYQGLFRLLGDITPLVQALPPDSALLDVTGSLTYWQRTPAELADLIQTRVLAKYGLHASVGGAGTRMLASITAQALRPGTVRILPDDPQAQLDFLHQQPLRSLPGVGPALDKQLKRYGLETIGDLAELPEATLHRVTGLATGRLLHSRALGQDPRRITPAGPPPSITARRTWDSDVLDGDQVRQALLALSIELGARLRQADQVGRRLELEVTFADKSHLTRTRTLTAATSHSPVLQAALYDVFDRLALQRARVRAVAARVGGLTAASAAAVQLTFDRAIEGRRQLEPVIDRADRRFGQGSVLPAALARRSSGTPKGTDANSGRHVGRAG